MRFYQVSTLVLVKLKKLKDCKKGSLYNNMHKWIVLVYMCTNFLNMLEMADHHGGSLWVLGGVGRNIVAVNLFLTFFSSVFFESLIGQSFLQPNHLLLTCWLPEAHSDITHDSFYSGSGSSVRWE